MNTDRHRIVFNEHRGQMVAVAEIATARPTAASTGKPGHRGRPNRTSRLRACTMLLAAAAAWACMPVGAQIIADPAAPANQRATVLADAIGRPLVNIQTPNASGVSLNTYRQFDVATGGIVLNNARGSNPWLATGEARLILNQVNSSNPSLVNGNIAVAGTTAEVVIANPSGIRVNGGSFTNVGRLTLTTGTPVLGNGALTGFRVQDGTIDVGANGLNVRNVPYTELLSRAAVIAGRLDAGEMEVNLTTGTQVVDRATGSLSPLRGSTAAPALAIDTVALGGMYAGRITMLATEAGVGVRNAGTVQANVSSGALVLTASGKLVNTGRLDGALTSIATVDSNLENTGVLRGRDVLMVDAGGDLVHDGTGLAQLNTSPSLVLLRAQGQLMLGENAAVSSAAVGGQVSLVAGEHLTARAGSRVAGHGLVTLEAGKTLNLQEAAIASAADDVVLQAQQATVVSGSLVTATGTVLAQAGSAFGGGGNVTVIGGQVNGTAGTTLVAGGNLSLDTAGNAGVRSAGDVRLEAGGNVSVAAGSSLTAGGDLRASAGGSLRFQGIAAGADSAATKVTATAGKAVRLTGGTQLQLQGTRVTAGEDVTLEAAKGNVSLTALAHANGSAQAGARVAAGGDLTISAFEGDIIASGLNASGHHIGVGASGGIALVNATNVSDGKTQAVRSVVNGRGNVSLAALGADKTLRVVGSTVTAAGSVAANAGGGVVLSAAGDVAAGADGPVTTPVRPVLRGATVSVEGQSVSANAVTLSATAGDLSVIGRGAQVVLEAQFGAAAQASASRNVQLHAGGGLTMSQLDAHAGAALSATSGTAGISATGTDLTAGDILSLASRGDQSHRNGRYDGGAVSLHSDRGALTLAATRVNGVGTGSTGLADVSGQVSLRSATTMALDPPSKLAAATDLSLSIGTGNVTIAPAMVDLPDELVLTPGQLIAGRDLSIATTAGRLKLGTAPGSGNNPDARVVSLTANGNLTLSGRALDIRAARLGAAGQLSLTSLQGDVLIDGVKSNFSARTPTTRLAELAAEIAAIDADAAALRTADYTRMKAELADLQAALNCNGWMEEQTGVTCRSVDITRYRALQQALAPIDAQLGVLSAQRNEFASYITVLEAPARGYEHVGAQLSAANIDITSARGIAIAAADIAATGQVNIRSMGAIPGDPAATEAQQRLPVGIGIAGLTETYQYGRPTDAKHAWYFASQPTTIRGGAGVEIQAAGAESDARLVINSAIVESAHGGVRLKAAGDLRLEAGQEEFYSRATRSYKTGSWYNRKYVTKTTTNQDVTAAPTLLSGRSIDVVAGGSLDAYGTVFQAPAGDINLTAANALSLYAVDQIAFDKVDVNKRSTFLGITYNRDKTVTTREVADPLPARLVAQSASTASGWNTLLQGTQFQTSLSGARLQAGVGPNARADAQIILEGIRRRVTETATRESNYVVWQKIVNRGSVTETLALPSFTGPQPPTFSAPGGLTVQVTAPEGADFTARMQALARQPGMAHLAPLLARRDVNWQAIDLANRSWHYEQQGLTEAGAALLTVAVAVGTGGMGAALLGPGTGGLAAATANAAFTSLSSQAAIAFVNNGGDLGATLKALGSSDTVKAAVAAALSAGAIGEIGTVPEIEALGQSTAFTDKLTHNLINAGGRALTNSAISGGSLADALKGAMLGAAVDTMHGAAASEIKALEADYLSHKLAHALAGCVAGAAAQGTCRDGAIGAAVGELVADLFEPQRPRATATPDEQKAFDAKVLAYSQVVAGAVAAYAGGNAQSAITTAQIAVQNNYLSKPQLIALQAELNACKQATCTPAQTDAVLDKYRLLSAQNDAALAACVTTACVETHRQALKDAASLSASVMWQVSNSGGTQRLVGELTSRQYQGSMLQFTSAKVERLNAARKELDQYVKANCQGLGEAACASKLQAPQDFARTMTDIVVGFTPLGILVDAKDLLQANSMGEFSLAALGMVPVVGDSLKTASRAISGLVDLTEHRSAHILSRHRHGAGIPGKTEFPSHWTDGMILQYVSDIATDPKSVPGIGKWNSPYAVGVRDGVTVRVDFYPNDHPTMSGKISTAYPIGITPNPLSP